jgi:hypothetical protein
VQSLSPPGSRVVGLEPMQIKVDNAKNRNLNIIAGFITNDLPKFMFASTINTFSHIYDFDLFLLSIYGILEPDGELMIVTGDMTNISSRYQFPGELGCPDHVSFASEKHLIGYLQRNGFMVRDIKYKRIDGIRYSLKNAARKLFGKKVVISLPYTSPYRNILIRAQKKTHLIHTL